MTKTKCPVCGVYFSGTRSFDAHRVGEYATRNRFKTLPRTRRCLSVEEMTQRGWSSTLTPITNETGRPTRRVFKMIDQGSIASVS